MKDTPLLFCAEMVRAFLDGRKVMTRRLVKPQPRQYEGGTSFVCHGDRNWSAISLEGDTQKFKCPYGMPGDRIWGKETHYHDRFTDFPKEKPDDFPMDFYYRADGECCDQIPECECATVGKPKWRPSIFMPKWASRIHAEITEVRVEHLQDITESDAKAEGVSYPASGPESCYRMAFKTLWEQLHGGTGHDWNANPFVWVIKLKKL